MLKEAGQLSKLSLLKICMIFKNHSSKIQFNQSYYRLKRGKKKCGQNLRNENHNDF